MVEQVYKFSMTQENIVEKLIFDENINYIHAVFNTDDGLPEHDSNANVYMTVLQGTLSIGLDEQEFHEYTAGTVLKIPEKTRMNVRNRCQDKLELIIVKAPAPQA